MTILFVADRPSSKNTHENVALVGTQSMSNLQRWLIGTQSMTNLQSWYEAIGISPTDTLTFINQIEPNFAYIVSQYGLAECPIIALGHKASAALAKLDVKYCGLPHPSGRNRVINNKEVLAKRLAICKTYLNSFK